MAKTSRKRRSALFEVMASNRSQGREIKLSTPSWWFKRRPKPATPDAAVPSGHVSDLNDPTDPSVNPTAAAMTGVSMEPGHSTSASAAQPELGSPASQPRGEPQGQPPAPKVPGVDLKLDPERYQIQFRVTYTSAIVTTFTVLVVIGLSYLIGKKVSRGPAPALATQTTEQLRLGPPKPAVLNVKPGASTSRRSVSTDPDDAVAAAPTGTRIAIEQPATAESPQDGRIIGRQYVVIQIYKDPNTANEARELLAQHQLSATVEKGLPTYAAPDWYCVVGLTGFDRIKSNPEYERYIKSINAVSQKFAGQSKFKKFDPQPYRWRGNGQSANADARG